MFILLANSTVYNIPRDCSCTQINKAKGTAVAREKPNSSQRRIVKIAARIIAATNRGRFPQLNFMLPCTPVRPTRESLPCDKNHLNEDRVASISQAPPILSPLVLLVSFPRKHASRTSTVGRTDKPSIRSIITDQCIATLRLHT